MPTPLSTPDYLAACLIVVGMVGQFFHRRLPAGLGTSVFVGAASVGASLVAAHHPWAFPTSSSLALRVTAGLCLTWAIFGWLAAQLETKGNSGEVPSSSGTFLAWSLVTGIAATVLFFYVVVFHTWARIVDPTTLGEGDRKSVVKGKSVARVG